MLNRRHLRIKVLQALYAYEQSNNENYSAGEKELLHSIDKMYDLYVDYLQILPELKRFAERKIEERKRKVRPTEENLAPNLSFVENDFLIQISENAKLDEASDDLKVNWVGDVKQDLIKKLFTQIEKSDVYIDYMSKPKGDFAEQKAFIVKLFKSEVCNSSILLNYFEEVRIHWTDDFDHVFSMIIKLFKSFKEGDETTILDLYKDDEEEFILKLFRRSVSNFESHTSQLAEYTKNWDSDRLAKMDIFIMNLAITEAKEFNQIPLKVTLNEYIEISKFYSTPKSSNFINGVLDKVFGQLTKDGAIRKVGRGLV
jgi:N utilization substance protein B